MGTVTTERIIHEDWFVENGGQPGSFGCLSRDATQTVYVDVGWRGHAETIELVHIGDSCEFDLLNVDWYRVRAAAYPSTVLINATNAPITLSAAPYVTPDPKNPLPVVVTNMNTKIAELAYSGAPTAWADGVLLNVPLATVVEAGDLAYIWADVANSRLVVARAGVYLLYGSLELEEDGGVTITDGAALVDASAIGSDYVADTRAGLLSGTVKLAPAAGGFAQRLAIGDHVYLNTLVHATGATQSGTVVAGVLQGTYLGD